MGRLKSRSLLKAPSKRKISVIKLKEKDEIISSKLYFENGFFFVIQVVTFKHFEYANKNF